MTPIGYREGSTVWQRCMSVSVDNTAGAPGAIDITISMPSQFDPFWDEIDASCAELRVTNVAGTKLVYSIASFSVANRTLTISVDGYDAPAAAMCHILIWWSASGAATGVAATTIASAKTGYVDVAGPAPHLVVIRAQAIELGQDQPRARIAKGPDETVDVWLDLGSVLGGRLREYANSRGLDLPSYVSYTVELATVSQTTMRSVTWTRYYGGRFVRLRLTAGSEGDYTVVPIITTIEGRVLAPRFLLTINAQTEA